MIPLINFLWISGMFSRAAVFRGCVSDRIKVFALSSNIERSSKHPPCDLFLCLRVFFPMIILVTVLSEVFFANCHFNFWFRCWNWNFFECGYWQTVYNQFNKNKLSSTEKKRKKFSLKINYYLLNILTKNKIKKKKGTCNTTCYSHWHACAKYFQAHCSHWLLMPYRSTMRCQIEICLWCASGSWSVGSDAFAILMVLFVFSFLLMTSLYTIGDFTKFICLN